MKSKKCVLTLIVVMAVSLVYGNKATVAVGRYAAPAFVSAKKASTIDSWVSIDTTANANKALFFPYCGFQPGFDYASEQFTADILEHQKKAIPFNLWNIIIYHFYRGELTLYLPFNPDSSDVMDSGSLNFPFTPAQYGSGKKGTFMNDPVFRKEVQNFRLLGETDLFSSRIPIRSKMYYGEDSILNGEIQYYPREFIWYTDQSIVQYELKESRQVEESGTVVRRKIDAIAPMVNIMDVSGMALGRRAIFWIDFDQLRPFLSKYYLLKEDGSAKKIISFREYFEQYEFSSTLIREADPRRVRKE